MKKLGRRGFFGILGKSGAAAGVVAAVAAKPVAAIPDAADVELKPPTPLTAMSSDPLAATPWPLCPVCSWTLIGGHKPCGVDIKFLPGGRHEITITNKNPRFNPYATER